MSDAQAKIEEAADIFRHLSANEPDEERRLQYERVANELDQIILLIRERASAIGE